MRFCISGTYWSTLAAESGGTGNRGFTILIADSIAILSSVFVGRSIFK